MPENATANANPGDLAAQVAALPWYHSIDLPGGITTPGVVNNRRVLPRYHLPASLAER